MPKRLRESQACGRPAELSQRGNYSSSTSKVWTTRKDPWEPMPYSWICTHGGIQEYKLYTHKWLFRGTRGLCRFSRRLSTFEGITGRPDTVSSNYASLRGAHLTRSSRMVACARRECLRVCTCLRRARRHKPNLDRPHSPTTQLHTITTDISAMYRLMCPSKIRVPQGG